MESILWTKLGSKDEYEQVSDGMSVAVFVREIVGLSKEKVNQVLSEYLKKYNFNSQQEEFLNEIVVFVLENGDISTNSLVDSEPFKHQNYTDIFEGNTTPIYALIGLLHDSIRVSARI